MNYRTTCPHCNSIFRLGTDQLEAEYAVAVDRKSVV